MIPVANSYFIGADIIGMAISKGARLYASISGGKDGQAMVKALVTAGYSIKAMLHADLGRVEWHESLKMCKRLGKEFNIPLHIVRRSDNRDLIDHWEARLEKLSGTGKPFWSSSANRYCTSDLKRDPINMELRHCGDFVISCEGVRAEESAARSKKCPLDIRWNITSKYYSGMTIDEAIQNFKPGKRLALTWYPIFNYTISEVWATYGMSQEQLEIARKYYQYTNLIPDWWQFHPAYVYGNDRVSCVFCIMGSLNDLKSGAHHRPELLAKMIEMEKLGQATFKNKFSLNQLLP